MRRSRNAAVGGIVDDDVLDDHAPHQDVDAGVAKWCGGLHEQPPTLRAAPDGTSARGRSRQSPSGLLRRPRRPTTRSSGPGPPRTNATIASTASARALEDGLDRPVARVRAPTRPRRAARPPGASSRGRRRPARARARRLAAPFEPCRYGRQMTALEGELDACGGAAAPPSAAARLREVLDRGPASSGRAELAKPRSGMRASRSRSRSPTRACSPPCPRPRRCAPTPSRSPSASGCSSPPSSARWSSSPSPAPPTGPDDLRLRAGELPGGFLVLALPGARVRPRARRPRLRRARRTASTGCGRARWRCRRA